MSDHSQPPETCAVHYTDIAEFLRILHEPGDCFEIRILDCPERPGSDYRSTAAGWFIDPSKAAAEVARIEKLKPPAVFVSVNPCNSMLLARSMNRVGHKAKSTTKDPDILRRRWLFVDIDPVRPAGISSTDAELTAATAVAEKIREAMRADGWSEPLRGMSGNGHYLMWRIDLPNDDESSELVEQCLKVLAQRFNSIGAEVDCSTCNSARICKVLGTVARKGDELIGVPGVDDRPHRQSWFIRPEGPLLVVAGEKLKALAEQFVEPERPAAQAAGNGSAGGDVFERCCKYLEKMEPAVSGELGSRRLYNACCVALHDFGLPQGDAVAAIERAYNPRCVPPWDRVGIDRAIKKALADGAPGEATKRRASSSGSASASSIDDWGDPSPLPDNLPSVLPYRDDLLPAAVGDAVADIAERMQCPADFPAASMLVALAAVVGCKVGIRPRRFDDWLVIPNLWGCVIGRPSLKKSPAIAQAEKRIRAIEARDRERLAASIDASGINGLLAEAKIKALKEKIAKAMKDGVEFKARELAGEIAAIEAEEKPIPRRIITSDATIEKLVDLLNIHKNGMLLWCDELVGWLRSLDREDRAGVRQQFLTLWNGQGRLNVDRIGRGETSCDSPCLSLFGCATPGGLSDYVAGALRGGRGDDGLLQRLQIVVWPDAPSEFHHVDRWPNSVARDRLANVFNELADIDPEPFAQRDQFDDGSGIPWVRFDIDGQAIFDRWDTGNNRRLRAGDLPEAFESHISKFASVVPSIALVVHLASGGRGPVSGDAAAMAVRWADYLESHAKRIYAVAVAPERQLSRQLVRRLIEWPNREPISVRAIVRHGWAGLGDPEGCRRVLELLVELGWLRAIPMRPDTGRPTVHYLLHPRAKHFYGPQNRADKTDETSFGSFDSEEPTTFESNSVEPLRARGVI